MPTATQGSQLLNIAPILFVRDVSASASFYEARLGFRVDFLYGEPPFYGAVKRDGAHLHLRPVSDVRALFAEYKSRHVEFAQDLVAQVWGGLDFHVRDLDGNTISFVQFEEPSASR
jgi:catechol 2,3-dioxygenase-like lactoylglutathione lyase family enzyme